jgi:hypothetical protein
LIELPDLGCLAAGPFAAPFPARFVMISQTFVVAALLLSAGENRQIIEDKFPDGAIRARREVIVTSRGEQIPDGHKIAFYHDGKPRQELEYIKGKLEGPWREYYPTGDLKIEGNYRDDLKDGLETRKFHDGTVFQETNYLEVL